MTTDKRVRKVAKWLMSSPLAVAILVGLVLLVLIVLPFKS